METDNENDMGLFVLSVSIGAMVGIVMSGAAAVYIIKQLLANTTPDKVRPVTSMMEGLEDPEQWRRGAVSRGYGWEFDYLPGSFASGPTLSCKGDEEISPIAKDIQLYRKSMNADAARDAKAEELYASFGRENTIMMPRRSQEYLRDYQKLNETFIQTTIIMLPRLKQLHHDHKRRRFSFDHLRLPINSWLFGKSEAHLAPAYVFPKPGEVELTWMYGLQRRFTSVHKDLLTDLGRDIPLGTLPGSVLPRYEGSRSGSGDADPKALGTIAAIFQRFWNLLGRRREVMSQRPGQNTTTESNGPPPRPETEEKEGDFFLGADMVEHKERRAIFASISLEDLKDDRDFYMLVRRKLQAARALSKANGGKFEVPSDFKLAKFFFLPSKTDFITTIPYEECSDNPFTPPRPYYHGTNNPSSGTPEPSSETTAEIWDLLRRMDPDIDKAMRVYFQILGEYIRDGVRWPDSGSGLTNVLNMLPRRPSPPALERKPWVKEWCFHASYAPTGRRHGYLWAVAIGGMLVSVLFAGIWLWRVDAKDLQNASTVFLCFAAGFAMLQMIWAQRS